jgi:hypothetical protein
MEYFCKAITHNLKAKAMTIKEGSLLISQLNKENESNSESEKEFNLKWIELIKMAMQKSALKIK